MAETLLIARNEPIPRVRQYQSFKRGQTKAIVRASLRDGPKTTGQIGLEIATSRPTITPKRAMQRAYIALAPLEAGGVVVRNGRFWILALDNDS